MESATAIQTLLQPPSLALSHALAQAQVNSRFTSIDDLAELDIVVQQSRTTYDGLATKLSSSQHYIDDILNETRRSVKAQLEIAQELSLHRHSLHDDLAELARDLVCTDDDENRQPTLLEDLETLHRNLNELLSVKQYVQVIERSLQLSEDAVNQVRNSTVSADSIKGYKALQDYVSTVTNSFALLQSDSNQNLNLIGFLQMVQDKTWVDIKNVLFADLSSAAEAIGWPTPVNYISHSADKRQTFESSFFKLLRLQILGRELSVKTPMDEKPGLYPLQALVQPIALRFKYHFEGSRKTNKLEKPEWYLTYVQNVAHEHMSFLNDVVQRLLAKSEFVSTSAWKEFVFLLHPLLSRKLRRSVPQLLTHPALLAHTISQTLLFDASLKEAGFNLEGTSAPKQDDSLEWEGVSEIILGNADWFEAWLDAEKAFVDSQFNDILSSPDAWLLSEEIDHDTHSRDLRPTVSARRIKSLVQQVTDRYSHLPRPIHKAHFLIVVQLPLLESYHARLASSLTAFETLSSVFVRAVPGALNFAAGAREATSQDDTRSRTTGTGGTASLCKALLSSEYLEARLESLGDEVFFLQLWEEFSLSPVLVNWAKKTHLLPGSYDKTKSDTQQNIFGQLISMFHDTKTRSQDMIVQLICSEVDNGLRAHHIASTMKTDSEATAEELSQTVLVPIGLLSSHLTFLRMTLPITIFTELYRRIARQVADRLYHQQFLDTGYVSFQEGQVIRAECELWVETCSAAVEGVLGGGRLRVQAPWNKVLEAGRLIGSDTESWNRLKEVTLGAASEAEWEAEMVQLVGICELEREEVAAILKKREIRVAFE